MDGLFERLYRRDTAALPLGLPGFFQKEVNFLINFNLVIPF